MNDGNCGVNAVNYGINNLLMKVLVNGGYYGLIGFN